MKRTDEPTKSQSLEGKFYLKAVAKLLSEKPEDISVIDWVDLYLILVLLTTMIAQKRFT